MELLEAIERSKKKTRLRGDVISWSNVARMMNEKRSPEYYRSIYRRSDKQEVKQEVKTDAGMQAYIEYKSDGTQTSERVIKMSETDMKNPEFVLKAHGFDPSQFQLVSAKNNFWTGYNKEAGNIYNYQSKIVVKPKTDLEDLSKEDIKDLFQDIKPLPNNFKLKPINNQQKKYALEIDFADYHIGSMSWGEESGQNYDHKIAQENIKRIVDQATEFIETYNIEKIYLCFLGDFLHIDTVDSKTSQGTQLIADGRPKKIAKKALETVMYIIENLAISDTEVIWIEGNHSRLVEYAIFMSLPYIYSHAKHIKFHVEPISRKAFLYKGNLVGLHHGEMKKDEMFTWLQIEQRDLWAKAKYAEQHSGHTHQEYTVKEKGGIIQRTNPTIKAQDLYEYENGWKSYKATIAYLWSEQENLKAQFYLR